jgi:hypothetical protein
VKEVNRICENAKVSIRSARHIAQKQIKSDEKRKVIGTNEANGEMKRVSEGKENETSPCEYCLLRPPFLPSNTVIDGGRDKEKDSRGRSIL